MADENVSATLQLDADISQAERGIDRLMGKYKELRRIIEESERATREGNKTNALSGEEYFKKQTEAQNTWAEKQRAQSRLLLLELERSKRSHEDHGKTAKDSFDRAGEAVASYVGRFASIAGTIEIARRSISAYADFERAQYRVGQEAGATGAKLRDMGEEFQALASTTGRTTAEMQEGFRVFRDQVGGSSDLAIQAFRAVAEAAQASGVSLQTMSKLGVAAIKDMNVPINEMRDVLDVWVKTIPTSMMDTWSRVGPNIIATLRDVGYSSEEAGKSGAAAFTAMSQALGSSEKTGALLNDVIKKATDSTTMFGRMSIKTFTDIRDAGGTAEDQMEAVYQQAVKMGAYEEDLYRRGVYRQRIPFSAEQLDAMEKIHRKHEQILNIQRQTGEEYGTIANRLNDLGKSPLAALEKLAAASEKMLTQLGEALNTIGLPKAIADIISSTARDIENIVTGLKWVQQHAPKWMGGGGGEKPREPDVTFEERFQFEGGRRPEIPRARRPLTARERLREEGRRRQEQQQPSSSFGERFNFQEGGSFTVAGAGGIDRQPVGFMATAGERVAVSTPMQESLYLQQEKADIAVREHFARFRDPARQRADPLAGLFAARPGAELPGGTGGMGGLRGFPGTEGGSPGGPPTQGGGGRGPGGGPSRGGGDGDGTQDETVPTVPGGPLRVPTSPQEAPQSLEEAYEKGFLRRPTTAPETETVVPMTVTGTSVMGAQQRAQQLGGGIAGGPFSGAGAAASRRLAEGLSGTPSINIEDRRNNAPTNVRRTAGAQPLQLETSEIQGAIQGGGTTAGSSISGGGLGALAADRQKYANEMRNNPRLRDMVAAMGETEVSSQKGAWSGHVEAAMNRASATGKSLYSTLNSRYYDPYRKGTYQAKLRNLSDADRKKWNPIIDQALRGSNTTDLSTGTASGPERAFGRKGFFGQGPGRGHIKTLSSEHFGEEAGTGAWRRRMALAMNAAPGTTVATGTTGETQVAGRSMTTADIEGAVRGRDAPAVGGGGVIEMQGRLAAVRKGKLAESTRSFLEYGALETGLEAHVGSGGQRMEGAQGHTGSHRHDRGGSADYKLWDPAAKRYLDMRRPEDRVRMESFVRATSKAGATGQGAGMGYMGAHTIHTGGGKEATWGAAGGRGGWLARSHAAGRAERLTPQQLTAELKRKREGAVQTAAKEPDNKKAAAPTNVKAPPAKPVAPASRPPPMTITQPVEGRQEGGPAKAGEPYMVGEAGPELFVPGQSGVVQPGGQVDYSALFAQHRALAAEMQQPIRPQIEMPKMGPIRQRASRRVERQREVDVGRGQRYAAHSDIGFS
jgi:TP901 family phage tail tape measure protein